MIVVDAHLVPHGDPSKMTDSSRLCFVEIVNEGGTRTRGNYKVTLYSRGRKTRKVREEKIVNWPRQAKPAWELIAEAFIVLKLGKTINETANRSPSKDA